MPLDTNIALQVKPVADPMESYGNMMSLRALAQQGQMRDMQMQEAQRKQTEDATLADLYRGAVDPSTGAIDKTKMLQGMAGAGLGSRIPAYQKQLAEADKATADVGHVNAQTGELQLKAAKSRLESVNGALSSLLSRPNVTHDDIIQSMSGLVQQGVIDDKSAVAAIRGLPGDPAQLRPLLVQKALESMDAEKRLAAMLPKVQSMNLGGTEQMVDMNPLTNPKVAGQTFNRTATPDAQLSASTTRRGQDMTDARSREQLQQGKVPPGYRAMPDGSLQAIPGGPADANAKLVNSSAKVLPLIDQADELLNGATGSYVGAGADAAAAAFGKSTKGAQATAKLKALEGSLMMAQPRMEGPQSDKDVALYRQMAGQIGDSTVPVETRRAALQTIRELHQKYAGGSTSAPPGAVVPIKSDTDYANLPSGTRFKAPDGTIRVKP